MQWCWVYQPEQQRLAINIGEDELFVLPYKPQQLINIGFKQQLFSVEDAATYQQLVEALEHYGAEVFKAELDDIALCALACLRFGCPQMPQSWHFQKSDIESWDSQRTLCELNSGFDQGVFLILEIDDEFASCMLLNPSMQISAIKRLKQFQVIKVLHNRLLPATIDLAQSTQKLA